MAHPAPYSTALPAEPTPWCTAYRRTEYKTCHAVPCRATGRPSGLRYSEYTGRTTLPAAAPWRPPVTTPRSTSTAQKKSQEPASANLAGTALRQ